MFASSLYIKNESLFVLVSIKLELVVTDNDGPWNKLFLMVFELKNSGSNVLKKNIICFIIPLPPKIISDTLILDNYNKK